jgi:hypothetical protein
MGASKIYIFDNGSDPPLRSFLEEFIARGEVEVTETPTPDNRRDLFRGPMDACMKKHGHKHTWISLTDADEYIVVTNPFKGIPEILKEYEQHASVSIVWNSFGTSGHIKKPEKPGVIGNYWRCHRNIHVKSFSQPKYVDQILNNHFPELVDGQTRVDILGNPLNDSKVSPDPDESVGLYLAPQMDYFSKMFINHYQYRYLERYVYKKFKGYSNNTSLKKFSSGIIGQGSTTKLAERESHDINCTLLQMPTRYMNKEPKI